MSLNSPAAQSKREIGSYFHWVDATEQEQLIQEYSIAFEEDYRIFYSGRHALKYLISHVARTGPLRNIWMPRYYCQHVANWMKKNYVNLRFYDTHPFEFPEFAGIPEEAGPDDILIINNYWGIGSTQLKEYPLRRPTIIEDHSHGWLTRQSCESRADYCFISLRKSLPVPMGGICWKPGGSLPDYSLQEDPKVYAGWDRMVIAMEDKKSYLEGTRQDKSGYLKGIADMEDSLDVSLDPVWMRPEDTALIHSWMELDVLKIKEENLSYLFDNLSPSRHYSVIRRPGFTTFGLMLLFHEGTAYHSFRNYLISNNIYPSNLWPHNEGWEYFLNIHVDFRYGREDMKYLLESLETWNTANP